MGKYLIHYRDRSIKDLTPFHWFPFDTLSFDMSLSITAKNQIEIPDPPFREINLYQFLGGSGYVFGNREFGAICNSDKKGAKIHLKFRLVRKAFAKIAFIVYAALVVLYVFIILFFAKKKFDTLVMTLVGFFISIWSLRQGLNSFSEGYTTVVDYFFLFVPLILLLVILAKIVTRQYDIGQFDEEKLVPEEKKSQ